jgi:hypothetical protein
MGETMLTGYDRHDLIAFGKAIPDCDATDGILRDDGAGAVSQKL